MATHRVYLLPGFFGFTHMGEKPTERIVYFGHVRDTLLEGFQQRGLSAEVEAVTSHPTANLQVRAQLALRAIAETASQDDAALHLVGHSTGGLDARGIVSSWMAREAPHLLPRVRSVVSVSTPHHGTPLASFFHKDRQGEMLLRLLWLFTVFALRRGSRPMTFLAFRLFYSLSRAGHQFGFQETVADKIARMLAHLTPTEQKTLEEFLAQVGKDQSLIEDLTPGKADGFNQLTPDQPHVRYGSVVTGAPPPSLMGMLQVVTGRQNPSLGDLVSLRILDPEPEVIYGAFSFLHKKSAPEAHELRTPEPTPAQAQVLRSTFGEGFRSWSDGIVPTRSQVWGEVISAVTADHLDVMGHFDEPPHHVGWLKSGSRFRSPEFKGTWGRVLDFMVGAI
jgi:pimeloyl-ACP methyl ester carboxylesterase